MRRNSDDATIRNDWEAEVRGKTVLLLAGEDLQQQLGHHSPAFTLKAYGHLLPRGTRRAVDALEAGEPLTYVPISIEAYVWRRVWGFR
jgi:hypothetical protein